MFRRTTPLVALMLVMGTPAAAISIDDVAVYADESGHFWAGLVVAGVGAPDDGNPVPPSGVGPVNLARVPIAVDQCHRNIRFDLIYQPSEFKVGEDTPSVSVAFEFYVELLDASGTEVANRSVTNPGHGLFLATAPVAGDYTVDLYMLTGADASWNFTVKGLNVLRFPPIEDEPACAFVRINEVEANPAGSDYDSEWIELFNGEFFEVDISGWRIDALGGAPQNVTIPADTVIAPGGYAVLGFNGLFVNNEDEQLRLTNSWGIEVDATPVLADEANDSRTNQFTIDGSGSPAWVFRGGTPGAANT